MEKYYFIGIKGSGMSSLAHILKDLGHEVSGSDIEEFVFTEQQLKEKNIQIDPFGKRNIQGDKTYIIGNAFNESNSEEVREVLEKGYKHYFYHDFLRKMSIEKTSVGVAGVHGKTSTTSFLAHVLDNIKGTSYLVGDGNGKGNKSSDYFVFEACEYRNHFLHYRPCYGIITNIDFDHPDFFKNERDVVASFTEYVKNVRKKVLVFGDDGKYKNIIVREQNKLATYGFEDSNEYQAQNVKQTDEGVSYDFYVKGEKKQEIKLPLFGKHNVLNSLASVAILYLEKVALDQINTAASDYKGAKRRFQIEQSAGYTWVNDYAHHPVEITSTIEATQQKFPGRKIVAIFQPHTFTRTAMFEEEFKEALSGADVVYGCDIFGSAREKQGGISIQKLMEGIPNSNVLTEENVHQLNQHKEDILLFMGAGDIEKYIKAFQNQIIEKKAV